MGGTVGRIVTGVATGGISEVGRAGLNTLKPPAPPVSPPPISEATPEVQQAAAEAARRRSRARGFRSTLLSQFVPDKLKDTFGS